MIFLGTTFCSGRYSLLPPATNIATITAIQIYDGEYSRIVLTTDTSFTVNNFDDEWNAYMKMNVDFSKGVEAGNSDFTLRTTDKIVIKRREMGTYNWIVIYEKDVKNVEDFNINIKDTYARAGVEYEYCVSSYLDSVENSYVISNVYSDFEGFYITDKDCLYGTVYNVDGSDTSRNVLNQTLSLINSKYMTVVSNSQQNYDSGSISGTIIKNSDGEFDAEKTLQYRNQFKNRLANKKPLILKIHDGRIWMIRATESISDSMDGHKDMRQISFSWVEVGDVNDMKTLYMNGFSDIDSGWWQ